MALSRTGVLIVAVALSLSAPGQDNPGVRAVSFERDVLPLLEARCNKCHHAEQQRGGLDLTRRETILRGGDSLGAAVVPGRPDRSPLIGVLTGALEPSMPEDDDPLAAAEVDLLRQWVAEGATDDSTRFPPDDVAFFEREIRPVLVERCFKCHAGEDPEHGLNLASRHGVLAGGARGPAAAPGDPEASLLMEAIRHTGELQMPRGGDPLSAAQIAAFGTWIDRGLPWPSDERVLARERRFSISQADREHWAFRPLPPALPAGWSVDRSLRAHHDRLGIAPASAADRRRLLRRVTYDLIGYPPTPEEIEAFVDDRGPDAYQRVVDRLLASPHYGWWWGRHWLDYTRSGANGQSNRGPAFDAARYEAWVTRCFNEDRPWNWFARAHVAGDLMPGYDGADYSIEQALAAAAPLNGPRTFEEASTETFVLMDKLDEEVEFLGRSLMGISLECARCHDHKFDPVSQRDYYALLGFFQSSWYEPVPVHTSTRRDAAAAVATRRELLAERARLNGYLRTAAQKISIAGGGQIKKWQRSRIAVLAPVDRRLIEIEQQVLRAEQQAAEATGDAKLAADYALAIRDNQTRLARYAPPDFPAGGGAILGKYAHVIGGHKQTRGLLPRALAVGLDDAAGELEEQDRYWKQERARWSERGRFGGHRRTDPEVAELAAAYDRVEAIEDELANDPSRPWLPPKPSHLIVCCEGGLRRAEELPPLDKKAKAAGLRFNSNSPDRVWLHPYFMGDSRLLLRGDVLYPDTVVPRGTPEFLGSMRALPEGSGRLQLAEWLTEPGSQQAALVARTAANRAWQNLFGEALCRTPKDLGRLGDAPEMPELVDGLAKRFAQRGWSVKSLVREIVTSAAYQRSSVADDQAVSRDPENRFFARGPVRRLQYEAIANTMAWHKTGSRPATPALRDAALPAAAEYFVQFDGPSTYELIDRRNASIAATQALFLMNQQAAVRGVAKSLVARLGLGESDDLDSVLAALYTQCYQRLPTEAERASARGFVQRRREQVGAARVREEVQEYAGLLLCSNEAFFVE
ncbi:Planctomycete cytochrome C [Pirellulimonas nuda]|uniref:Planctomycete cytochrome C n=1 Tax=Pirellulimonas nuda TaxID=2528009 RepID=A0A518DDZ6_9BACT|nr:PSD1 and planctomycete cytochrome C domain-containing protein [Pirellulimonas nuda]QDU89704.1 Planctomycete cytochrome C [Pirellulimonas nuda]